MISGLERILWSETFTPNNTLAEQKKYYLMAISITFLAELSLFFREKLHFGWKRMMKSEESSDLQKRKGRDDSLSSLSSLPWISVLLSFFANTYTLRRSIHFISVRFISVHLAWTCGRVGWLRCGLWIAATACWWRTW